MYTQNQINKAKNMDLLEYIRQRGYSFFQSAANEYRLKEHDSLVISNNKWKWFSRDIGGDTLDFVTKYEEKGFKEAMEILIGEKSQVMVKEYDKYSIEQEVKEISELPEKADNYRRLFAYLAKTRRIDPSIIQDMINDGKLYQEKEHNNCVFLGKNKEGEVKYCLRVGTNSFIGYKGEIEGSNKAYSVDLCASSDSPKLYIYESIIDAMSHATIIKIRGEDYKKHNRIFLAGVGNIKLEQFLKDNPNIKIIVSCLDNDKRGIEATEKFKNEYEKRGYRVRRILPISKDFNKDLTNAYEKFEKKTMKEVDNSINNKKKHYASYDKYKNSMER